MSKNKKINLISALNKYSKYSSFLCPKTKINLALMKKIKKFLNKV